ncbi:putative knottin, scorpion toxin, defensin, plant, knottin, scorpion toxin-like superfamily [Helianthus annuus]|nr:putative knottin, scorpion toxin, defensin, plant, knottin, scorpion toxin-like superfamily [Helianthus annuus]
MCITSIMKLMILNTIFITFMYTEMGGPMVVEARTCLFESHKFQGACFSDTNCGNVCKSEGFLRGTCRGFRHGCFCASPC